MGLAVAVMAGVGVMQLGLWLSPFQPPAGAHYNLETAKYVAWIRSLPVLGWYYVLGALLAGAFISGAAAQVLVPAMAFPPSLIAGFVLLFYAIVQFLAFYNPEWMTFASCIGSMIAGRLGGWSASAIIR
jgi:hypothetical protein